MVIEQATEKERTAMFVWLGINVPRKFKMRKKMRHCMEWNMLGAGGFAIKTKRKVPTIYFRNKEDAMAFKLMWI